VIRPGVVFGSLDAGGLIELQGNPPCKHVRGKVVIHEDSQKSVIKAEKEPKKIKPSKKGARPAPKKEEQRKAHPGTHKNMGGESEEPEKKHKWRPW
jgi:hypothetical protein